MKAPETPKEEQGPPIVAKAGPEETPRRIALTATEDLPPRKSPVTVQEWVDSLPHPGEVPSSPVIQRRHEQEAPGAELADTLALGAEAELILRQTPPSIVVQGPQQPEEEVCEVQLRRREAFKSGERVASFASDSAASNASSAGVESFLESRKLDPETILLNLGFGGSQDSSNELGLSRIPQRFLQPSSVSVKGISISQFYNNERHQAETFETGFYGYRGLTGPSHTPSPIVAKIMERLRHHERSNSEGSVASAPAAPQTVPTATSETPDAGLRFAKAAQKVQNSKSVLTRIQSWKSDSQHSSSTTSVLNADNRRFMEKQALSKSPDVPRRIIMGRRSYTFSGDGDLIECLETPAPLSPSIAVAAAPVPKLPIPTVRFPPPLVHKDSMLSSTTSYSDDSDESEEEFRRRSFLKRTRPLTPPPELPTPPVAASTPNAPKPPSRMVSTSSFSSWESDSWVPSPPAGHRPAFSTFSSIEESCEQELLSRTDSEPDCLRMRPVSEAALAARRGSLKRQNRVSEDEEPSTSATTPTPEAALSRTSSAQSDSSGFQEESANTASHSGSPEEPTEDQQSSGSASPVNAARLIELQDQASKSLETFRAQVLAETNPEKQALIQVKVDQISGVLLQLQSLCENFQEQEG